MMMTMMMMVVVVMVVVVGFVQKVVSDGFLVLSPVLLG